jgi:hypothetical protein
MAEATRSRMNQSSPIGMPSPKVVPRAAHPPSSMASAVAPMPMKPSVRQRPMQKFTSPSAIAENMPTPRTTRRRAGSYCLCNSGKVSRSGKRKHSTDSRAITPRAAEPKPLIWPSPQRKV